MPLPARLLIANRGEIACRIARTARRLGIETVAVHSDADATALHVAACDRAVRIGAAAPAESYLRIDAILDAARRTGADAVHPGYGFLAENAEFAEACASAGLIFVGPPAAAIRAMGSKAAAKELLHRAGVPLTPGYHGEEQEAGFLRAEADRIGYPVLIKASAGGGGKGMRRVDRGADFAAALASCRREAACELRRRPHPARALRAAAAAHRDPGVRRCAGATASTCSSATARCSGATRRSWRKPPRRA